MGKQVYIVLLFILLASSVYPFVHAAGQMIVDADGNSVLKRGMGLGGWLVPEGYMLHTPGFGSPTTIRRQIVDVVGETIADEFYSKYHEYYVTREDILQLASWGFDHIRMPFHYKMFSPSRGVWDEWGFTVTDSLLSWCKEAQMHLVLDMHCAPGGQNHGNISDSDGTARLWLADSNKVHTIEIWEGIASRYAHEPWIGGYDLLNEPVLPQGITSQDLRSLYYDIRKVIRTVDNNHIIFIEGNWYATDFSDLTPPFDVNMAYNFHKYWSANNQGSIQDYLNIRGTFNVPLWMSESGENSNTWFYDAVKLFEEHDIGWCWWTHKKVETVTSPYSASMPPGFQELIEYWDGNASKPTIEFATTVLMSLTDNLQTKNCVYRPGIIPALFDPEFGTTHKPLKQLTIPGKIYAADYDLGGQGVAYLDADWEKYYWEGDLPWNRGYQYRNDGVDIEEDETGIPNVGWTESGEWMKYTFSADYAGMYDLSIELASTQYTGSINFCLDEVPLAAIAETPVTGSWQTWEQIILEDLVIGAGEHVLKLKIVQAGFNLRRMEFTLDSAQTTHLFPNWFKLGQNYPNPFNGGTTIPLEFQSIDQLTIEIIDIKGQILKTFIIPNDSAGYDLYWDGHTEEGFPVVAGVYLYRGLSGDEQQVRKMLYLP